MFTNLFKRWAQREYSGSQRLPVLLLGGTLVVVVIPSLLVLGADFSDNWLHVARLAPRAICLAVGAVLAAPGLALALWCVAIQFSVGRGTPAPIMPTKQLIAQGPYRHSRNPMMLGIILYYLGAAIGVGSPSAVALAVVIALLLVGYVKLLEERELAERFGAGYLAYKEKTPFLIPWPRKRGGRDKGNRRHEHLRGGQSE